MNLRVILGFRTSKRTGLEKPEVLYIGEDGDAAQAAVDAAGPQYLRVERAEITETRKARRAEPAPAVEAPAQGSQQGEVTLREVLEGMKVAELKERCEELGIVTSGFRVKEDYIDAIVRDDELSELKVDALREKAAGLGLDLTGLRRKREFLDAIEAHERAAARAAGRGEPAGPDANLSAEADD